ncbi:MAG: pitrilysin family protein, partial [Thermomicrobiales bacterium]
TERHSKGAIFRTITAAGGSLNGFTWLDYTAYYETLPIDRIEIAFDIESDRMVNSRFDPDEVASERTVIISERQGNENSPTFLLNEEITAASFKAHPYGQGVIGYMSDLRTMTRDDLYRHYQTYYRPNNAVAVFVGDLDADDALDRIQRYFGGLERGPEIPDVRTVEPEQFGERRVTVRRPAPNRVVSLTHHSVAATHPDAPALIVLDAVLSGGKPMGFGGGAAMGRSSRLYRALVATGMTASAGSSMSLSIDPLLFGVSATLRPEADAERVEQVLVEELDRLASEPVGAEELERAMKQIRAQFTYSQQSVSSKAYLLGSLAMVAPERTPRSLIDDVLLTTAEDVQRVAATYLTWERRTTGWLIPGEPGSGKPVSNGSVSTAAAGYVPDADDLGLDTSMPALAETRLDNGLRVMTLANAARDSEGPVVVRMRIPGGSALDE